MALTHLALLLKVSNDYSFEFTDTVKKQGTAETLHCRVESFLEGRLGSLEPCFFPFSAKPPFHLARPMSHVLVLEADVSRLFLVTLLDN